MDILSSNDIDITGFAGVRERVYVMDRRRFTHGVAEHALPGVGSLCYLADAHMRAGGQTGMHAHQGVTIVSILLNGTLLHRGSLGDGGLLHAGDVQVQRAGKQGFQHNEINPGPGMNRFLQLWFTAEDNQDSAGLVTLHPAGTPSSRLYEADSGDTVCQIRLLEAAQTLAFETLTLLFVIDGKVRIADTQHEPRILDSAALCRAAGIRVTASCRSRLLIVST